VCRGCLPAHRKDGEQRYQKRMPLSWRNRHNGNLKADAIKRIRRRSIALSLPPTFCHARARARIRLFPSTLYAHKAVLALDFLPNSSNASRVVPDDITLWWAPLVRKAAAVHCILTQICCCRVSGSSPVVLELARTTVSRDNEQTCVYAIGV